MKQDKYKTGTVYFICNRKTLTQTSKMIISENYNMLVNMCGNDLPYMYYRLTPAFVDEAPRRSEDDDMFKGKCIIYKLSSENKKLLAYTKTELQEIRDWFSEQIGQKVIAVYKSNGVLARIYDFQRRENCGMTVMLIVADGFEYVPTEKHKEPVIKETTKLAVYENLCLSSVENTLNAFGLHGAKLELNNDNTIRISFDHTLDFTTEIERVIKQKQDEIFSLLFDGKFKKAIEGSLKPKFDLYICGGISFDVKEQ